MKRCTHSNAVIREESLGTNMWFLEEGKLYPGQWNHSLTGGVYVACPDCGMDRYWKAFGKRPQWLVRICQMISEATQKQDE
jgi:hypothetical protein